MSLLGQAKTWLGDLASYRGSTGVIHLAWSHLIVAGEAILIASVISLPIGVALGHFRRGGASVTLLANATRAIPTLGLLYLLAGFPSFGVSQKTAVISLALFAIPPILTNAWAGVSTVEPEAVDAARGLGMSSRLILTRVEMPLAVPLIFAGIRSSTLQTFATATIASYVGADTLGNLIQTGQAAGQAGQGQVLGAAIIIALMAVGLDLVLALTQRKLSPKPLRTQLLRVPFRRATTVEVTPGVG